MSSTKREQSVKFLSASEVNIQKGADFLVRGELVIFPTETVYGLGADATCDQAVQKIYQAKGRPGHNPLIVHFSDIDMVQDYIDLPAQALILAQQFWPGPLTLVLSRQLKKNISSFVSPGLETIAIRIPQHKAARDLIKMAGRPIAAPSANLSGKVSPTSPQHLSAELLEKVACVIVAGQSNCGLESTVLSLVDKAAHILRPGSILKEDIESLGIEVREGQKEEKTSILQSPGLLESHYAPTLPVRLNADSPQKGEAFLAFGPVMTSYETLTLNLSEKGDLQEAAHHLFDMLQKLDQPGFSGIAVMPIPDVNIGLAINDRLRRAAASRHTILPIK